jgi:murein DD-endopeptidase MepM/ murein hydrolase activator NlpD
MRVRAALFLLAALPAGLAAQDLDVAWYGTTPKQGMVAYVVVGAPIPVVSVRGTLDGAPLAFSRIDDARFVALAAVAVGAPDTVVARLRLEFAKGRVTPVTRALPVTRTRFPMERLSVDPRFTEQPDSALAARIARESAMSRHVTAEALATPGLWHERFLAPRQSRITSTFGIGRVFNGQIRSRHLGVDFDGSVGDPIRAANRGVVALADTLYYSGGTVLLNHGGGLITGYFHMSRMLVSVGDTVERGQIIGRVGRSGRVTGPHLHWSVRVGSTPVDGRSLLALSPVESLFKEE